ncbi:MAG: UDP-N-acetylmuramate--L-alanine ligase [Actinobacteria bacterium]|nr:UDP-N-acetylmuramate--L-alanine ligase [Actinomycetota bacterium]
MVENAVHIHFIGIGGAGMSGIAKVLLEMGYRVSGSDLKDSRYTHALKERGAVVTIGHVEENLEEPDTVVVSSAIPKSNPEVKAAKARSIPIVRRAEMLAWLGRNMRSIAVAGTHGKTTTTSMISFAFEKSKLDPTFLIGGELNDIGSNAKHGNGEFFITEADESDGSLLYLKPEVIVVTNIEADHLDYYDSLQEIEDIFLTFVASLPENGFVVACADNPGVARLMKRSDKKFVTYGIESREAGKAGSHDFTARNVKQQKFGSVYDLYHMDRYIATVSLNVLGIHNVCNSLATIALSAELGLNLDEILSALSKFSGVKRRFQLVGKTPEVTLIDDYAHHPTEVMATLSAARNGDWERLICIFQPHRYSRTKFLGKEFGMAFKDADIVVLTDVYAAGEEPIPGVTGKVIVDAVLAENPRKRVVYLPKKGEISKFLLETVREGDLVLTMGAGDICAIGEDFLSMLTSRRSSVNPDTTVRSMDWAIGT